MRKTKDTLWSKNFTLVTAATVLGAAGGIAGGFALSFLVYDETGSTLAAAILLAIGIFPNFLIPLIVSPIMDRLPRKPFLVGGDLVNGVLYGTAGVYLMFRPFSYVGYLFFSLLLASLSSFDMLAYDSIFPRLIPEGMEEKGYSVSTMIYPVLKVVMMPAAAVLLDTAGVAVILIVQAALSVLAAAVESRIEIKEERRMEGEKFSFRLWREDVADAVRFLKKEKGLQSIYLYMAVTNAVGNSFSPILIAFFRTAAGFTAAMYSLFSAAEFAGRSIGGFLHYHIPVPEKKRFSFAFFVYQTFELMDAILLWLPYPLMLINRALCGFLGINSAILRMAAVQSYLPEEYRVRLNAFNTVLSSAVFCVISLLIGALGEVMDYRLCLSAGGIFTSAVLWLTMGRQRKAVAAIYNQATQENEAFSETD